MAQPCFHHPTLLTRGWVGLAKEGLGELLLVLISAGEGGPDTGHLSVHIPPEH